MPSSASRPPSNVAAAAALQFSVDFDPTHGDTQPSVLLLTQNVGGIDAAYSGCTTLPDASPGVSPTSDQLAGGAGFPTLVTTLTTLSYGVVPEDVGRESGVPAVVRQQVADFLADLRTWLHRVSFISAAARKAERAGGSAASSGPTAPTASQLSSSSSPPPPPRLGMGSASGSNPAAGQAAESFLHGYTAASRPPMIDVIVIHFQEIGGKYKNKQFNRYFKEQLSAVLLPEAGWTSGLLMDERESDRGANSSSAERRTRATTNTNTNTTITVASAVNNAAGAGTARTSASPTSVTGHLRAPVWDYIDLHSCRSSNDISGTETDASEGEEADPFFTAMGTIIFLSPRVMGITSCLSVPHRTYIPIVDDPMTYAGDAGRLFLSGKFSEAGRSRKGFLMVSLRIGTVQFNVCNLHLFNDDDNRVAFEQSPSKYAGRRIRAVLEAMAECSAVIDFEAPLFLFGDYNVRMDGKAFVQWAEEQQQIAIRTAKKQLRCPEQLWGFFEDPSRTAEFRRLYDGEPQRLMDEVAVQTKMELGEMPVTFAPTYSRVPYRQRGGGGSSNNSGGTKDNAAAVAAAMASVTGLDEVHTIPQKTSPAPNNNNAKTSGEESLQRRETDELNRTQTPSAVAAAAATSASSSPLPSPSLIVTTAVTEPLSHVVASAHRSNFCRDRLPAWCDRVLFNVAGLEWISGDRARPPLSPPQASSGSAMRDQRKAPGTSSPPRWYVYEAIDFVHMDHDGVYLMF